MVKKKLMKILQVILFKSKKISSKETKKGSESLFAMQFGQW